MTEKRFKFRDFWCDFVDRFSPGKESNPQNYTKPHETNEDPSLTLAPGIPNILIQVGQ